jgi:hypothetical protein
MRCQEVRAISLAWLEGQGHRALSRSVVSLTQPAAAQLEVLCEGVRGLKGVCRFSYEVHTPDSKREGIISGESLWLLLTDKEREQVKSLQHDLLQRIRSELTDGGEVAIAAMLAETAAEAEGWMEYRAVAATPDDVLQVLGVEAGALSRL